MKLKGNLFLIGLGVALSFSGCTQPDPTRSINDIGLYTFLVFCVIVILSVALPRIQNTSVMESLRRRIKKPMAIVGFVVQMFGIWMIVSFLASDSTHYLFTFIGAILVIGGFFLRRWGKSSTSGASVDLKIITLSISFIVALLWLIFYAAEMIKF